MPTIQAKSFFNKGPVSLVGNESDNFKKPDDHSFLESVWNGLKTYGSNVGHDFYNNAKGIVHSIDDAAHGKQSVFSAGLQTAGGVAKSIFAPVNEAVKPVINKAADTLSNNETFQKIANSSVGDKISETVDKTTSAYSEWAKQHPEASKNLESSVDIATLLAGEKPANKLFDSAKQGIKSGAESVVNTTNSIKNAGKNAISDAKYVMDERLPINMDNIHSKVQDLVTPIDKSVITELEKKSIPKVTTKERLNTYFNQAEQAMADNSKPTPLELAGSKAQEALTQIDTKLKSAGQLKNAATQAVGKNGAGPIVQDALSKLETELKNRFGGVFDKTGEIINTKGRSLKISDTDKSLIKTVRSKLTEVKNFPTVQRVDDAIDFIQRELYKSEKNLTLPANKEVNGFLKEIEGTLNRNLKKVAGTEYSKTNATFSNLKHIRDNLNKALGVDANKGASLMKQLFSPNGTASKKLFEEIKKLTGIDLVNEATLAKFVMESVGDARQSNLLNSLLENPQQIASKSGMVKSLYDTAISKIKNPKAKAIRIIEKRNE